MGSHRAMIIHGCAIVQWNYPLKKWNAVGHNLNTGNWPSLKVMRLRHARHTRHIERKIHAFLIVNLGHLVFYQDLTFPAGLPDQCLS